MRLIKMFGLAAITAVAAMAFIGASSASAQETSLCSSNEGGALACADGVNSVHFIDPSAELLSVVDITCNALLSGTIADDLDSPLEVTVTELNYTGCVRENGSKCTVTTEVKGTIDVLKTAADLAEVTGLGTEVHVQCGILINCTYGAKALVGHGLSPTAGNNGLVTSEEATVTSTKGGFCPASAKLDALFESLTALYVKT